MERDDSLLIVYPTRALPASGLSEFLGRGGRIALADDYGSGESLLRVYGITRRPGVRGDPATLRSNPGLPVARAAIQHPLTEGVGTLVTNHPAILEHAELRPIFALEGDADGLLLTGAVGEGRLLALSDPSVLINNMLEFRGNRRFARNLLRYLGGDEAG
ncbi:MAG: hypothetical protein OEY14_04805, partial [Myxococcales bacterium]|nr:hypothetical protein [Myxococcales bacterium]